MLAKGIHSVLYISRLRIIATYVDEALNVIGLTYLKDILQKGNCNYNLLSSSSLTNQKCNTLLYGLNKLRYKEPKIWNSHPNNLTKFKFLIKNGFARCLCGLWIKMSVNYHLCIKYIIISIFILNFLCVYVYMRSGFLQHLCVIVFSIYYTYINYLFQQLLLLNCVNKV